MPKDKTKISSPLGQNNWGISGVVTPKDKTKTMPGPLVGKKEKEW